jgi:hypothetical protein
MYEIQILTPSGIHTLKYNESENLQEFEKKTVEKYGTFITIQSKKI